LYYYCINILYWHYIVSFTLYLYLHINIINNIINIIIIIIINIIIHTHYYYCIIINITLGQTFHCISCVIVFRQIRTEDTGHSRTHIFIRTILALQRTFVSFQYHLSQDYHHFIDIITIALLILYYTLDILLLYIVLYLFHLLISLYYIACITLSLDRH